MYSLKGEFYDLSNDNKRHLTFCKLIRCGALCNNADFINDKVDIAANPTEAAIIKFSAGHISAMYRMLVPEYREQHNKLHEIPFNSKNKWQISVHELPNNMLLDGEIEEKEKETKKHCMVQMKGAPERILAFCDRCFYENKTYSLDDENDENNNVFNPLNGGIIRVLKRPQMIKIMVHSME